MSEILLAEHCGFCFGVRQAIEKTEEQILKKKREKSVAAFIPMGRLYITGM